MTECPKCHMMIFNTAWAVHHELNHQRRARNSEALQQARSILAAKREAQRIRAQELKAKWDGTAR